MTPYAVFDVDLTLTRQPTWSQFLRYANKRRPLTLLKTGAAVLSAAAGYGAGRLTRTHVREAALRHAIAGRRRDELLPLAEAFTDELVANGMRPGALRAIERHKSEGHELAVATAGVDLIIDLLCDRLGIAHRLHTPLSWRGGVLHDRFEGENCYADQKETRVVAFLDRREGRLHAFYSDHVSDLNLLRRAERAVAVNPSPRLRRAAQAEGIPIENWNF